MISSAFGSKMKSKLRRPCKQTSTGRNKARIGREREGEGRQKRERRINAKRRKEGRRNGERKEEI